jgi:cytochrome c peroxidase
MLFISLGTALLSKEPINPIPESIATDNEKAALGKMLFFDTQLSKDDTISCASCHILKQGGDDNLQFSFGINGQKSRCNAPTVYNSVFNFRQFWNGRAKDLQEQAGKPIENPLEMGFNFSDLIKKLNKTDYKEKFKSIYKDGITKENITNAIAEYEKTLITPNSPFDNYLKGDKSALTKEQKEGYELFKAKGCVACHQGINVGGNMYNKFGIFEDSNTTDLGRYEVTHRERDKYYFKVPSLRNIAKTAPYFHDGRTYSLRVAVLTMAEYQLGRKITLDEADKIVAFLHSLSGKLPQDIEP